MSFPLLTTTFNHITNQQFSQKLLTDEARSLAHRKDIKGAAVRPVFRFSFEYHSRRLLWQKTDILTRQLVWPLLYILIWYLARTYLHEHKLKNNMGVVSALSKIMTKKVI